MLQELNLSLLGGTLRICTASTFFPCLSVAACCIQEPRLGRRGRGQADLALPGTAARLVAFTCLQKQTAQLAGVCCTPGTSTASRWGGRAPLPHPCSKLRAQMFLYGERNGLQKGARQLNCNGIIEYPGWEEPTRTVESKSVELMFQLKGTFF